MRRFEVYRPAPPSEYLEKGHANAPDEVQYEGVVFTDGTVCIRWRTPFKSHSLWASFDDLMAVHGHPEYGTVVKWTDPESVLSEPFPSLCNGNCRPDDGVYDDACSEHTPF